MVAPVREAWFLSARRNLSSKKIVLRLSRLYSRSPGGLVMPPSFDGMPCGRAALTAKFVALFSSVLDT